MYDLQRLFDYYICNSHNTELMPISSDESFKIEYSQTKGMEMEFYRGNNIVDRQQFANEYEVSPSLSE